MSALNILTCNILGLNDHRKCQNIFLWLMDQSADIVFLQETFFTKELEPYIKSCWKGRVFNACSEFYATEEGCQYYSKKILIVKLLALKLMRMVGKYWLIFNIKMKLSVCCQFTHQIWNYFVLNLSKIFIHGFKNKL